MRSLRVLLIAAAASSAGPASRAQESIPSAEPWGYLYFLRTEKLFPLSLDESSIGRLSEENVVLTSPRVSRRHALVRRQGDDVELEDVGSSNGTKRNGEPVPPRTPVALSPGDRLEFADEVALYHRSLTDLWVDELRHRLLARIVKLRVRLPEDRMRKALGREEVEPAVTEVRVNADTGSTDIQHSVELDLKSGFPEASAAFVGDVVVREDVLQLSLWALAAGESMTSRRSSFTNLKHATLRVNLDKGTSAAPAGPWFGSNLLAGFFDVFPDEPEFSLQFAVGLAGQERREALSDAAATLSFRHRLNPAEWKLILMAAQAKGLSIDREIGERGLSLVAADKARLQAALEQARTWLEQARALGAKEGQGKEAEATLVRASERLARIQASP